MFIGTDSLKDTANRLIVYNVEATIDHEPTKIDESSPTVLKYRTPNFR